jgi:hypothetical protein
MGILIPCLLGILKQGMDPILWDSFRVPRSLPEQIHAKTVEIIYEKYKVPYL